MRWLLQLLTLIALVAAPIAAPAAATAVMPASSDCANMSPHDMPLGDHGRGEPCCIAVPPAIDPPRAAYHALAAPRHLAFSALTEASRLGAGPHAEDPPPRIA